MKRGFLSKGLSVVPNTADASASTSKADHRGATSPRAIHPPIQKLYYTHPDSAKEFLSEQGMKHKVVNSVKDVCILGFGLGEREDLYDTLIITYMENRIPLREHPGFSTSMTAELTAWNASFVEVVPKAGKGLALVAKRDIPARQVFVRERPLLYMLSELPNYVGMNMDETLKHMPKERKAAYDGLYNCKPRGPHMVDSMSIARTNALGLDLIQKDRHLCVCELISRANHDCTPTAYFHFNSDTFCGELWSLMPITAGTEVTITYITTTDIAATRNAELKQKWGFVCTCPACDNGSSSFKKSEERRQILGDYRQLDKFRKTQASYAEWLQKGYQDSHIEYILGIVDAEHLFQSRAEVLAGFADAEFHRSLKTGGSYARMVELCHRTLAELAKWEPGQNMALRQQMNNLLEKAEKAEKGREEIAKMADGGSVDTFTMETAIATMRALGETETADRWQRIADTESPDGLEVRTKQMKEVMKTVLRAGPGVVHKGVIHKTA